MRYHNTFDAPEIAVLFTDDDHQVRVVSLRKGEGDLTKAEFDAIAQSQSIRAFVADGYLSFPASPEMQELYKTNHQERLDRERALWGEQEDRAAQTPQDLTELTDLVGRQAQELLDAKAFNADLVKAAEEQAERTKKLEAQVAALLAAPAAAPTPQATAPAEPATAVAPTPPAPPAAPPVAAPPPPPPPAG